MSDSKKGDATPKKQTLVERIMSVLKLDDSGLLYTFFKREVNKKKRLIRSIENNTKTRELQHLIDIEAINEKIEDALMQVEDVLMNVDVENIKSNASKDAFSKIYWERVEAADERLDSIKRVKTDLIETFLDANKASEVKIADIKIWISRIDN